MANNISSSQEYHIWRDELITFINSDRTQAILKVNSQLLQTYWKIGKSILTKQEQMNWGSQVIKTLAKLENSNNQLLQVSLAEVGDNTTEFAQVPLADNPSVGLLLCKTKVILKSNMHSI